MINSRGVNPAYWSVEELVTKFVDQNHAVVGADGVSSNSASKIRNFVSLRRNRLASEIPIAREFSIMTGGGEDFTVDSRRIDLEGEAWVDVYTVALGGEILYLEWMTEFRWRTEVSLDAGENELLLVAFDVDGNIVGSDSITVTSTFGWKKPTITSVVPGAAWPGELFTVRGTDLHEGLMVLFDGTPSPNVLFDESVDVTTAEVEVPEMPEGAVRLTVLNVDGRFSEPVNFAVIGTPPRFIRGDINLDGVVELGDAVRILTHLFGGVAMICQDAADVNDDEVLDTADAMRLLDFLYEDGEAPEAPFPDPGWESEDEGPLDCGAGL